MTRQSQLVYAVSFCVAAVGFFLPLWPLCVLGILIAAFSGRFVFAVIIGLLIDLAWGAPHGMLHVLYVPFTLVAVVAALARYILAGYFLDRSPSDTL